MNTVTLLNSVMIKERKCKYSYIAAFAMMQEQKCKYCYIAAFCDAEGKEM